MPLKAQNDYIFQKFGGALARWLRLCTCGLYNIILYVNTYVFIEHWDQIFYIQTYLLEVSFIMK